ncbi:MAG: SigB/SigF/SigG family RNA polymerase sigma factor [Actinomycetota bacterium]|nr:SigB/SigF/SigG family RNA polymerase sigma factor [Actinomycetota bacterium]
MSTLTPPVPTSPAVAGDTAGLFLRWHEHRDQRSRDALIERFLPLAQRLARRYVSSGEPYEDLVQIASLGLVKAVERFDPERGYAFSTFAVPTIVGELKRYFRDAAWSVHVDRGAKDRARQTANAQHAITARSGRAPTVRELAQYLERSEEEVLEALQTIDAYDTISLDAPAQLGDEGSASRIDTLGGHDERLELVDDATTLFAAAKHLPKRERQVLLLRFAEDLPQTEIARRIGVSQMHVSRLLRNALKRLRELTAEG